MRNTPVRFHTVAVMVESLGDGDSLLLDVTLQLPLDARVRAERVVHDEVVQNLHPGAVLRQVVVVFCSNLLHLGTSRRHKNKTFTFTHCTTVP